MKTYRFDIEPVAAVRTSRGDVVMARRGNPRPAIARYYVFREQLNILALQQNFVMPEFGYRLVFHLPMPASWSAKKRREMCGQPHQQRPDKDNLEKAFLDALLEEDSHIWDGRVTKLWAETGHIILETV